MAQTPNGGQRDTQWVLQYRPLKTEPVVPGQDIPQEELLWTRYGITQTGAATKAALAELRTAEGYDWRAVRIETTQRVEDW